MHIVPDTISIPVAVAVFAQDCAAISFMKAYDVQKGDVTLIHTVANDLGFAKYHSAQDTIIGTTSTEENPVLAKQNGPGAADHVIIYKKENTTERVLEITNGRFKLSLMVLAKTCMSCRVPAIHHHPWIAKKKGNPRPVGQCVQSRSTFCAAQTS